MASALDRRSRSAAVVLLVSLLALLAACGGGGAPRSGPAAGASGGEGVSAVAAVYPLAWLADRIAPDAEVSLLNAGGPEAHDLEITPSQREAIETADVVLFVGDIGYQPQVEQAVQSAEGQVVSLTEVAGPDRLLEPVGGAHGDEGDEHRGDERATVDPHIWFDPDVMADAAVHTGEAFSAAHPDGATIYRENARELSEALVDLEGELERTLGGGCRHREAVVSHQAYRYLLEPFGVEQHGVTGIDPSAGASSTALAELVEEIEREGFENVLTEPVEGRQGAETVAREADVALLEISPLDAVTADQARRGFIDLVRDQAARFATALGC